MTSGELMDLARHHHLKINGIYLEDDAAMAGHIQNGFTVFNLDHYHVHGSGTHWTCAFCNDKGCFYFDSFGFPPSREFEDFIQRRFPPGPDYDYSHRELQDYYSGSCGEYCLAFGLYMSRGPRNEDVIKSAHDFLSLFSTDTKANERLIRQMGI